MDPSPQIVREPEAEDLSWLSGSPQSTSRPNFRWLRWHSAIGS